MRAPYEVRSKWGLARRLRRAKRRLERTLWTRDTGYGMGQKLHGKQVNAVYSLVSEAMGILESEARALEGDC